MLQLNQEILLFYIPNTPNYFQIKDLFILIWFTSLRSNGKMQ